MEHRNATQEVKVGKETQSQNSLPTLYEYFDSSEGQNVTGLLAERDGFKLNGKPIRIISGAIHYFRSHPSVWSDRLRKLRASGANTVETYVPWNLHEPKKNEFDFGQDQSKNDMSIFLDIRKFIQLAQAEDLLLILRPGPFICGEFEFGGMPSYLLRDPNMRVRTAYQPYLDRVKVYFDNLLPLVSDLQFSQGGPIIALQVENEYASFDTIEPPYLEFIRQTYLNHGINSLLFTSDGSYNGVKGSLPGLLKTANFQFKPESNLDDLLRFQPDKPPMVMEYWSGWFDHWFEPHSETSLNDFTSVLDVILGGYNASVNYYTFEGGTNFGFNAGANTQTEAPHYAPDVTSYDYDAPLTEAGDYTAKYYKILEMSAIYAIPPLRRPPLPLESRKLAYPSIPLERYLSYSDILDQIPPTSKFQLEARTSMENLNMNNDGGQSQGYILYRKRGIFGNGTAIFKAGPVRDFGILLLDQDIQPFPKDKNGSTKYWLSSVQEYSLPMNGKEQTIDLLIENMGRINFGGAKDFLQRKGLVNSPNESYYHLDGQEIKDVEIIALEFKSNWVNNLTNWHNYESHNEAKKAPILVQSTFTITEIGDTFIDMTSWTKGIVFINGFNLGRYFNVGPQKALYLPAPFLKLGENTITIFEQLQCGSEIVFSSVPKLGFPPIKKDPKPQFDDDDFVPF
ncbi:beta-galactosidase-1-like protein 2 isoform X2 [Folsomia candida]|uniref:Beta-galactosidase n=1 Tax=Folsomia candida TaxID=158441 RepID=A0A226DG29_FOLCA|nr:beta-galactosidase-1-like protein 2 isoform X2 [Folsomia candida]OXA43814.1 Beta-galactosidase-1-like protein 2 [Folsomia candida]